MFFISIAGGVSVTLLNLEGPRFVSVATPAEPRGAKKTFFVQILGGEKFLRFVEKCQ